MSERHRGVLGPSRGPPPSRDSRGARSGLRSRTRSPDLRQPPDHSRTAARTATFGCVVYVLGALVVAFLVALIVSLVRGQARVSSCCNVPPERDLRLREAFAEPER